MPKIQVSENEMAKLLENCKNNDIKKPNKKGEIKMQNKLSDLNNTLFELMERLNDDDLKGEALEEQLKKTNAISGIAGRIIQNAAVVIKGAKAMDDLGCFQNLQNVPSYLGLVDHAEKD
jgi:hypothetical protein